MKELVSAIENGLKKISKGNITRIELEETVASSRELYERLLIVRYKVYENSILAVEESEELEVVDKETEVEKEEETIPDENKDIEIIFEEETNDIAEDSIIRFDLFATPEIDSEVEVEEDEVLPEVEKEIEQSIEEEVLPEVCNELANKGVRVIIAGLDMDYQGIPFGPMPHLLSVAEYVTKVHAICVSCGNLAQFSQRTADEEGQVLVGALEKYRPLCRSCYFKG